MLVCLQASNFSLGSTERRAPSHDKDIEIQKEGNTAHKDGPEKTVETDVAAATISKSHAAALAPSWDRVRHTENAKSEPTQPFAGSSTDHYKELPNEHSCEPQDIMGSILQIASRCDAVLGEIDLYDTSDIEALPIWERIQIKVAFNSFDIHCLSFKQVVNRANDIFRSLRQTEQWEQAVHRELCYSVDDIIAKLEFNCSEIEMTLTLVSTSFAAIAGSIQVDPQASTSKWRDDDTATVASSAYAHLSSATPANDDAANGEAVSAKEKACSAYVHLLSAIPANDDADETPENTVPVAEVGCSSDPERQISLPEKSKAADSSAGGDVTSAIPANVYAADSEAQAVKKAKRGKRSGARVQKARTIAES